MSATEPDAKAELLYEVRHDADVVGPVTASQLRSGRSSGKFPANSQVRTVGRWQPVDELVESATVLLAAGRIKRNALYEVRLRDVVVGPVTLDQVLRGREAGKVHDGAEARTVGAWKREREVGGAHRPRGGLSSRQPTLRPPPVHPPKPLPAEPVRAPKPAPPPAQAKAGTVPVPPPKSASPPKAALAAVSPKPASPPKAAPAAVPPPKPPAAAPPLKPAPARQRAVAKSRRKLVAKPAPQAAPGRGQEIPAAPPVPKVQTRPPAPALPAEPSLAWQLRLPGETEPGGPFDTSIIAARITSGEVPLSAQARVVGSREWLPVWDIAEFADAVRDLPPASLRPPTKPPPPVKAPEWYLDVGRDEPTGPFERDQVIGQIGTGSVPLSARVRLEGGLEWIPVWDVPDFAEAIQKVPPDAWKAIQTAHALFDEAKEAHNPAVAIRLYASAAEEYAAAGGESHEALFRIKSSVDALARDHVATLLADDMGPRARRFVEEIRAEMASVGLEQSLSKLERQVDEALDDPRSE